MKNIYNIIVTITMTLFLLSSAGFSCVNAQLPDVDVSIKVDSVVRSMSTREKALLIYIWQERLGVKSEKIAHHNMPGGVIVSMQNLRDASKVISQYTHSKRRPVILAADVPTDIADVPAYLNPMSAVASGGNVYVSSVLTQMLTDTLRALGFNAAAGALADSLSARKYANVGYIRLACIDGRVGEGLKAFVVSNDNAVADAINAAKYDMVCSAMPPHKFADLAEEAVKKNSALDVVLTSKAKRILLLKYSEAEERTPLCCNDKRNANALCAAKSVVCIRNFNYLLPFTSGKKVSIVQIGGIPQIGFVSQASKYGCNDYHYVKPYPRQVSSLLDKKSQAPLVIILNSHIDSVEVLATVSKACMRGNVCLVNFCCSENLKDINGACIVQCVSNDHIAGKYAAMALFGAIDVEGRFPYPTIGRFKSGSGVDIKANRLKYCYLPEMGFRMSYCDTIDSIIKYAISEECFPGCQLFVAKDGAILFNKAFGTLSYDDTLHAVDIGTLYDLASLTKIASPTLLAMHLTEKGLMNTNKTLGDYLRCTDSVRPAIFDVTLKSILEHRSGIYAYTPIIRYSNNYIGWQRMAQVLKLNTDSLNWNQIADISFKELYSTHYIEDSAVVRVADNLWLRNNYRDSLYKFYMNLSVKKKKYQYSDVNMILLQWAEEQIIGCGADEYMRKNFYNPLGMYTTCFNPLKRFSAIDIAPTEPHQWTKQMLRGDVHDPSAALLGGVAGNAGLFSSAQDLGVLFQMLLNGGEYGGRRYLKKSTVENFTIRQPNTGRALGFDMVPSSFAAASASSATYGHTGFTGTCVWADPINNLLIVFLSNRVHPDANNKKINSLKIRRLVCQAVYDGLGITTED